MNNVTNVSLFYFEYIADQPQVDEFILQSEIY